MKFENPAKPKVVLDTSVYVSALLSTSGGSAKIFEIILAGKMNNFYTTEILEEVKRVAQRGKFNIEKEKQDHFVHLLVESSFFIKPLNDFKVNICRDPKDDLFLSLANQVEADYLVSLDMDLIELKKVGMTKIVAPGVFLALEGDSI